MSVRSGGVLQKGITVLIVGLAFGLTLLFSVVLLAAVVALGSIAYAYVWWKSRALPRQTHRHGRGRQAHGLTLEGEFIRE